MRSTMQDVELSVRELFRRGSDVFPDSQVIHYRGCQSEARTFTQVAQETSLLAGALQRLGVRAGDVVATLAWNTPAHLAAYFAVPSIGAVLHTLNVRLHEDQLRYIIDHAGDTVILVDADLAPQLAQILSKASCVRHVIVLGGATPAPLPNVHMHDYGELLAGGAPVESWPLVPERTAAMLCYTSGTTGRPKGVAYSHRSIYLHTLAISTGSIFGFSDADRILPMVPMFHANAWGWIHAGWAAGADLIMIGRHSQAQHLATVIGEFRPTAAAGVPTLWSDLDEYAVEHGSDLSSLRLAVTGGSAPSRTLVEALDRHHGVSLTQGWGMTETSPLLTFSRPPSGSSPVDRTQWLTRSGRIAPNVSVRVVDETGTELPWDGEAIGELELRGPTITGSYHRADPTESVPDFRDGWLRTGDLGVVRPGGWVEIRDRLKDGIKSGGEWISTIELENAIAQHPAVAEVAVIGVPHARWGERPLVFIRVAPRVAVTAEELGDSLAGRVARWSVPDLWTFVQELPKTSVGKLDKNKLRECYQEGDVEVHSTK